MLGPETSWSLPTVLWLFDFTIEPGVNMTDRLE